jgi:hypothetical protein
MFRVLGHGRDSSKEIPIFEIVFLRISTTTQNTTIHHESTTKTPRFTTQKPRKTAKIPCKITLLGRLIFSFFSASHLYAVSPGFVFGTIGVGFTGYGGPFSKTFCISAS